MPSISRLGLRAWLEEKLDTGAYSGVQWVDENEGLFSISWKHASKQGWIQNEDAAIFRDWAVHTGRYRESTDNPNPKTWKANFRCAMNASRDIRNVASSEFSKDKGVKLFAFTKSRKSSITVSQRTPSINLEERRQKKIRAAEKVIARRRSSQLQPRLQRQASKNHKYVKSSYSSDKDVFENNNRTNDSLNNDLYSTSKMTLPNNEAIKQQLTNINIKVEDQTDDYLTKNDELFISKQLQQQTEKDLFSLAEILEQVPPGLAATDQIHASPNLFDVNNTDIKDLLEYVDPKEEPMSDSDYDSEPYQHLHYPSSPDSSDAEEIADMFDFISNNEHQIIHKLEDILVPDFDENAFLVKQQQENNSMPPLPSINAPYFPALMNFKNDPFIGCHSSRFDVVKALKASLLSGCQ